MAVYDHIVNDPKLCEECVMINSMCITFADDWHNKAKYEKWFDLYLRHDPKTHITAPPKKTHRGNGKPEGLFAGTLTMSPSDTTDEVQMIQAIKKIFNQQTCPVKKWAWYVEYTDAGLPHIHFCYETETGGRIHQKVFKRYWKTWNESERMGKGFRGGYHKNCDSETAYLEYIAKDGGKHDSKGF